MACWPNHVTNPASRSTFQVLGRWKLTYRARRPALTQSGAALRDLSPTTMFSMPHSTADRRLRLTRQALLAAAVVPLLAGCALVMHKPHSAGSSNPWDDSAHPLTDDQAMAQVVEPAKQIVAADLQAVRAGFSFTSCNDQGDPPYQGTVRMAFLLQGDHDAYFQHVRAAMLSHGWIDGPPPGQYFHGITLHKNGVTANMSLALDHSYGEMILDGECRNTTDHHHDDETTNITNQLVQP